jgi:hypothetical protein
VVGAAADFDLVVMAGDHLDISGTVPLAAQRVVIEHYVRGDRTLRRADPLELSGGGELRQPRPDRPRRSG